MYCALILTGLFTTSSNWYGSKSTIVHLNSSNTTTPASTNSTLLRASYGWLDLGLSGGNGFLSLIARPGSSSIAAQGISLEQQDPFYRFAIPWSETSVQIPKRFYVGLGKYQGLGVWVDLGSGLSGNAPPPTASTEFNANLAFPNQAQHYEL
nr:conserved hypothetical protein [Melanopsichium pennsylvanicum 4]